jgi:CRISPR-associated endoribonuclease Cas6
MRIKVTLHALHSAAELPLNYQHAVASLIYARLSFGSLSFAAQLHDVGFRTDNRTFKLFTFSRLHTEAAHLRGNRLVLDRPRVSFQISSPVPEFIEHLKIGLSSSRELNLEQAVLRLVNIEDIPAPLIQKQMRFHALSPITETTNGSREHPTFLSLMDDWSEVIQRNLSRKYEVLHGRPPTDGQLKWRWDENYIRKKETAGWRLSVLADIHGIKVRGWLVPFMIEGSKELIEVGYEAGFGARNSMGFGMAEPQ